MIEQVEKIRPESQVLPFTQFERFANSQIHVLLWRSDNAVARSVAVNGRIAARTVGKRREGIGLIGRGIYPIGQARFWATVTGSTGATEPRAERRS